MSVVLIDAVRQWFSKCPFLSEDRVLGVEYLPSYKAYSIDTIPTNPLYKAYVDGRNVYQFDFAFTSHEAYDGDRLTMVENSQFYDELCRWIKEQNDKDDLPIIDGHRVQSVVETTHGYLYSADSDLARYQAQFKMIYT
jgi:hypothetical protein